MGWAATDRRSLQPRGRQSTAMPSRSFRSPMCWISLCSVALASAGAIQLPVVEQAHTARNRGAGCGREGRCAAVACANTGHTVAIFRQINKGALHINHDALEFPDGEIVPLTRLYEGT